MQIPTSIAAPALFAIGCGLLTAILLRRSYRYFARRRSTRNDPPIAAQPRPTSAWSGAHADATARIERQKVELHELGRDITGQIDSKLILLSELIKKSQAQIDRLEQLLGDAELREPVMHADER